MYGSEFMQVNVEEIPDHGLSLEFSRGFDEFPVLAQLQQKGTITAVAPVVCRVQLQRIARMIHVSGTAEVRVYMPCSRCLEEQEYLLQVDFNQTYAEELPAVVDEDGSEVELSAEQMGLDLYDGEVIDLSDEIQQQIVMAIPEHPLCATECKGLCSGCGCNLNQEQCECHSGKISMHFAALRDFKVEK